MIQVDKRMWGIRKISRRRILHDLGEDGRQAITALLPYAHHASWLYSGDLIMVLEAASTLDRVSMVWDPGFGGGWYVDACVDGVRMHGKHRVLVEALWQVVVPLISSIIAPTSPPLGASILVLSGERVRMAMRTRNITIGALAVATDLSPGTIAQYRNAVDGHELRHLNLLADALGVTRSWLLGHGPDSMVESTPPACGGGLRPKKRKPQGITRRSGKFVEGGPLV